MIEQYIPELEKVLIALERGDFEVNYPHEKKAVDGTLVIRVTMGEKPYLTFAGMHSRSLAAHIRERISIVRHLTLNLEAARKEVDRLKHLLHHENVAGMPGGRKPTHVDDRQQRGEPVAWRPIDTAPTDNKWPLYLARFHEGELVELDFNGGWEYWQESYEMPHINGYDWVSNNGIEEPTHWAYQDEPLPTTAAQPAEPVAVIRFERNKPGAENEMPKVISCNRLPDGDYQVFLAPQPSDPVKVPKEIIETLEGIVNADWRSWEELASPDEFVRWSKSRVLHTLALIAQYAYPDPVAPQPIEPCKTCNDRGAVGNILDTVTCPDCTPLNPVAKESLTVEPSANHKIKKGDMRVIDGILMTCTDPEIGRWQGGEHEPTDTEMLDWIERVACKDVDKYGDDSYWVDKFGSNLILEGFRVTISKAMKDEADIVQNGKKTLAGLKADDHGRTTAFKEGVAAAEDDINDCPYRIGTADHADWQHGHLVCRLYLARVLIRGGGHAM